MDMGVIRQLLTFWHTPTCSTQWRNGTLAVPMVNPPIFLGGYRDFSESVEESIPGKPQQPGGAAFVSR